MRRSFERALERNPHNWYAQFELGILAASQGHRPEALRRLAAAGAINPREFAIREAAEKVRRRERIVRGDYDRLFFERAQSVVD